MCILLIQQYFPLVIYSALPFVTSPIGNLVAKWLNDYEGHEVEVLIIILLFS
jgi:hypothetical protein